MTRVVLAFDGSPPARTAVQRSGRLLEGAEAVVVVVARGVESLADAGSAARAALPAEVIRTATEQLRETALTEARELAEEGVALAKDAGFAPVRADVRAGEGALWADIVAAASDAGADAVVCGTHGHGAIVRALVGSVASGIVARADLPVLVVSGEARDGDGPLVVGYDGSEHAERAIAACGRLLAGRVATVVYAWRSRIRHSAAGAAMKRAPVEEVRAAVGDLDAMFEQWAAEDAEEGARVAREHGLEARGRAEETGGPPSRLLLEIANEEDAAVIVVGRRGRGAVASTVLGSVSTSLLHAADRPVLVV